MYCAPVTPDGGTLFERDIMPTTRNVAFITEAEYTTLRYTRRFYTPSWFHDYDAILMKLDGADNLYKVIKSRHTGNAGRIIRMELQ